MALSLNDLKKGKAGKASTPNQEIITRRMVRPWEDPTQKISETIVTPDNHIPSQCSEPKEITNREQTGNKEIANREQTGNKEITKTASKIGNKNKQVTEQVTSNRVNRKQTDNKQVTNLAFEQLRGHEARLLHLIFSECQAAGDLLTPPMTLDRIAEYLESRKGTVKTVMVRLTKKGLIVRENSATGRGGYTRFRIQKDLYHALLIRETGNKRVTNREQTGNKQVAQRVTQRVTTAPSSSSNIDLNKETTTTGNGSDHVKSTELISTNPNWEKIDHESLKEIGFNASHVAQVIKQGLHTPQSLQDSIYAFKFDLNANKRASQIQGSALNYFMGILRKGPYAPPQNYESPEDRQLREYLEAKEKLLESKRIKLNRIKEIEFEEWMDSLSKSERDTLAPMGTSDHLKRTQLRNHFDEHIWELKKEKLVLEFEAGTGSESSIFFENTPVNRDELPPLTPP